MKFSVYMYLSQQLSSVTPVQVVLGTCSLLLSLLVSPNMSIHSAGGAGGAVSASGAGCGVLIKLQRNFR